MTVREPFGFDEPSAVPTEQLDVAAVPGRRGRSWRDRFHVSSTGIFAVGFLFLLAAVASAGFAHFTASGIAPWLSIGCSGGAVICTVWALASGRER